MKQAWGILFRGMWVVGIWLGLILGGWGAEAEISVKASLERGVTVIGESLQFQIKVTGGKQATDIPDIKVDGLEVAYAGATQQRSIQMGSGGRRNESSTVYVYTVVAEKNGTFTFPAVSVDVGGKEYQTSPVSLTVQASSADDGARPKAMGIVEVTLGKKAAYVGEMIPVEVRLYVDSRVRWQPVSMPELGGEGFTKVKMPEPTRTEQVKKNGIEYDLLTFKTAITPIKAGKMTIGPVVVQYNAQVPRGQKKASRSIFDLFGDDAFGDPIFSQMQLIKAKGEGVELTVKPLPVAGKPRSFSGAVGKFELVASGSPREVKMGDPVTMKLRVSGQGNFDRVEAPILKEAKGWRAYPASANFVKDASDELGIRGVKTFDQAVIPEERQTEMPGYIFGYFDPELEKYVELVGEVGPLKVTGEKTVVAKVPVVKDPAVKVEEGVKPEPVPVVTDILGQRYDEGVRKGFWAGEWGKEFWVVQGILGGILLVVVGVRLRGRPSAAAARALGWRREKGKLLERLRGVGVEDGEFFSGAARVMQIEVGLRDGVDPSGVDGVMAGGLAVGDEGIGEVIEEVFRVRGELLFGGGGVAGRGVAMGDRERIMKTLEKLGGNDANR
jgi:hypothetical protein